MTEHVIVTDDGPIRLVRMNRQAKKNALTSGALASPGSSA